MGTVQQPIRVDEGERSTRHRGDGTAVGSGNSRELTSSVSVGHFFGAEVRHWRLLRAFTQEQLAQRTFVSNHLIGKIELGDRAPNAQFTLLCDEVLETGGILSRLYPLVEQERVRRNPARPTLDQDELGYLAQQIVRGLTASGVRVPPRFAPVTDSVRVDHAISLRPPTDASL